jgi:hypothetical protein
LIIRSIVGIPNISEFLDFRISRYLGFEVSEDLIFKVSIFMGFDVSGILDFNGLDFEVSKIQCFRVSKF